MFNKKLILIISLLILLIPSISAEVGIIGPQTREIKFEPNLEVTYKYLFLGNQPIEVSAQGDYAEGVTFDKTFFKMGPERGFGVVYMTIKLPSEPHLFGKRILWFTVTEAASEGSGAVAKAAARDRIRIIVPFPGKYLEGELSVKPVRLNETIEMQLNLLNIGTERINKIESSFRLYENGEEIGSVDGIPISMESKERTTIVANWETKGMKPGTYPIKVFVKYDEEGSLNFSGVARIGEILLKILEYSKNFVNNKISPFMVNVTSLWNMPIAGVHSEIIVYENDTVKKLLLSPTKRIAAWQKGTLTSYLNAEGLSSGEHNINITVYYHNKTAVKLGVIHIENEGFRMPSFINTSTLLILLVLVLVLINIIILVVYLRRKKDGEE